MQIVAVEPKDSPILTGGDPGPHKIQGIGANFVPEVLDRDVYDEIIDVTFDDAIRVARELGTEEGILGGISAGAIVWAGTGVGQAPGERRQADRRDRPATSASATSPPRCSSTSGNDRHA